MSTSANTFYHARAQRVSGTSLNWQMFKFVANTATQLGSSVSQTIAAGNSYNLKLNVSGTTIELYDEGGGSPTISATDSAITAAGFAGLRENGAATDSTLYHLDNFSAEEAGGGSFSSTGALAAQDAVVAGSAAHLTLHAATGALSAQDATVSGAAVSPHLSTGALSAQAATVAGTAARLVLHGSTGVLEAQAAEVSGSASTGAGGSFDGVGVLTAQAAAIAGSAARLALHTATGSLVADAATVAGTAVHLTLHTSAGVLVAQEATVDGVAFIGDEPPAPSGIDIEYEFEPALWWQRKPKTLGNVKAKAKLAKVAKVIAKKAVEQVEKSAPEAQRKAEVRQAVAPMLPEMPGFDWKPVYDQAYSMALTAAIDAQMRQAEANQVAAREIERIRQLDEEDIAILVAMM